MNPNVSRLTRFAALAVLPFVPSVALAQWSASTTATFTVGDGVGSQNTPRVQPTADGGCYVSWYEGGTFDVRLQRLDSAGVEQWAHNGVLVADRVDSSTVIGGDIAVATDGSCFVCFDDRTDTLNPNVRQAVIQKVSPSGTKLWGAGGANLSLTSGTASVTPGPQVAAMPDGGCVVGWTVGPNPSTWKLVRLDADGNPVVGWTPITQSEASRPLQLADIQVVDASGSFVVLWVRASSTSFAANRYLYTQKYSAAGVPQWNSGNPVDIYSNNQGTAGLGVGIYFECVADGAGGAVYGWCETTVGARNANIQHVLNDGTIKFNDGGSPALSRPVVSVTTNSANYSARIRTNAVFAYNPVESSYFIASADATSGSQSQAGTLVQKINSSGLVQWGDDGVYVVQPIVGFNGSSLPMAVVADNVGGCVVFGIDNRGQNTTKRVIFTSKVDSEGGLAWSKILNSDVTTDKSNRMSVCKVAGGNEAIVSFGWDKDGGDVGIAKVALSDGFPAVTPECVSVVSDIPAAIGVCQGDTIVIPISVSGTPNIAFQWQKGHKNTGNLVGVFDGATGGTAFTTDGSSHSGTATATLTITNVQAMAPNESIYQCTMFNACPGLPVTSTLTTITVSVPGCPADYDCNGATSIDDLFQFLNGYFSSAPRADFNHEGGVTIDDLFLYLNAYFAAPC